VKVLAICSPSAGADMSRFARLLPEEGRALRELKASGTVLEAWSPGRPGAILILSADDISQAEDMMRHLPLAKAGLLTFELTPLSDIRI
jgi:muconolactone delta-isomerase